MKQVTAGGMRCAFPLYEFCARSDVGRENPELDPGASRLPAMIRSRLAGYAALLPPYALPDIKERLQAVGFAPAPTTPEEYDKILRGQIETFSKLVRDAGLRPK